MKCVLFLISAFVTIALSAQTGALFSAIGYGENVLTAPRKVGFLTAHQSMATSPLPMWFVSLAATKLVKGVQLQWKTANEENTAFFEIERSTDSASFVLLGRVAALGNRGTGNYYVFTDCREAPTTVYYRAKAVDYDGETVVSSTFMLQLNTNDLRLQAFPNPAKNELHVHTLLQTPLQVYVNGISGLLVKHKEQMNDSSVTAFTVDITDLPKGVYTLTVKGREETESLVFVKQ